MIEVQTGGYLGEDDFTRLGGMEDLLRYHTFKGVLRGVDGAFCAVRYGCSSPCNTKLAKQPQAQ